MSLHLVSGNAEAIGASKYRTVYTGPFIYAARFLGASASAAFRDAMLLAEAVLDGPDATLARYGAERYALSRDLVEVTERIAAGSLGTPSSTRRSAGPAASPSTRPMCRARRS